MCVLTRKYRIDNDTLTGNIILGHRKFLSDDKCSLSDKTAKIMAIPISSSVSAATTGYGCKNSILPLISSFCI
jgi:hypothetical protein